MSLAGRTLFITGASRGIGLAIALKAARQGANIAIAAKTSTATAKLPGTIYTAADEIEKAGGKALPLVVDVREETMVRSAIAKTVSHFGRLDIVVNNASAISLSTVEHSEMRRFDLMHQVNARGAFMVSKYAIPHLVRGENPHILMISPPLDMQEKWFAPATGYAMAKFGMSLVALGLAGELRPKAIAVNTLWPRTTIATSAIRNLLGGEIMMRRSRSPEIMAEAACRIFAKPAFSFTGKFLIDDIFLAADGVTDFDQYRVDPTQTLALDFFIPADRPPPAGVSLEPLSGKPPIAPVPIAVVTAIGASMLEAGAGRADIGDAGPDTDAAIGNDGGDAGTTVGSDVEAALAAAALVTEGHAEGETDVVGDVAPDVDGDNKSDGNADGDGQPQTVNSLVDEINREIDSDLDDESEDDADADSEDEAGEEADDEDGDDEDGDDDERDDDERHDDDSDDDNDDDDDDDEDEDEDDDDDDDDLEDEPESALKDEPQNDADDTLDHEPDVETADEWTHTDLDAAMAAAVREVNRDGTETGASDAPRAESEAPSANGDEDKTEEPANEPAEETDPTLIALEQHLLGRDTRRG